MDFRAALADDPCWDLEVEALFEAHGEPLADRILQNREELIGLCELVERKRVRSYLEIGLWTGRLLSTLHRLFRFDLVAACDQGFAETLGLSISVPAETRLFVGESCSEEYRAFREALGAVDLVFIDGDHRYGAVRADFERERGLPHRFLALHDICGARRQTRGVARLWGEIEGGMKAEIVRPHVELGLDRSTMGIGLWSATEDPAAGGATRRRRGARIRRSPGPRAGRRGSARGPRC